MRTICIASLALLCFSCSPASTSTSERLFVIRDGAMKAFDLASGSELAATVDGLESATGLQALEDGTLIANLTVKNEVAIIDGQAMSLVRRIPSSNRGASKPVHSFISPELNGRQYWLTMNDGAPSDPASNSALFIDLAKDSKTYLEPVAELAVGLGHHKAAFSATKHRVVISNMSDCQNVLSVYDFTDLADLRTLATLSAAAAGFDGSSRQKTCDPTRQNGGPLSPHGCATNAITARTYCNLTDAGKIVSIDLDADVPQFRVIDVGGGGGGATEAVPGTTYVVTAQSKPREGAGGGACQVGRLLVIDSAKDAVVATLPLGYLGAECDRALSGTDEATVGPGHLHVTGDGRHVFISLNGGFADPSSRSRQQLVVDLSTPEQPAQLPSISTGAGTGHRGAAMTGDHRLLFVANEAEGSVTQISCSGMNAHRTFDVGGTPSAMATWGPESGPSCQHGAVASAHAHDAHHHH